MRLTICSFSLLFVLLASGVVSAQTTTIDFNKDKVGEAPSGFSTALTGRGKPGKEVVVKDEPRPIRATSSRRLTLIRPTIDFRCASMMD